MYRVVKRFLLIFKNYFSYHIFVLSNFEQSKKETSKRMGELIQARRERLGISQAEIANALEIQPATVSRYESGKITVDAATLPKLAKLLRVNISFFYDDEDYKENSAEIVYEPILDALHRANYSGGLDAEDTSEVAEIITIKARRRAERQGRA